MNKNVLVSVLAAFLLLGGLGFYLWQEYGGSTSNLLSTENLTSMLEESLLGGGSSSSLESGEFRTGSIVPTLSQSVMFAAVVEPKNFEPLGTHLAKLRDRFAATAVWKKAGLDAVLDQYLNSSVGEMAAGALGADPSMAAVAPPLTPNQILALIAEEWSRIEDVVFAFDGTMFAPVPGLEAPKTLLAVAFKDTSSRERVQKMLFDNLLAGQDEIVHEGVTFKKASDDKVSFAADMSGTMGMDGASANAQGPSGSIEFIEKNAYLSLGADSFKSFVASSAGGTSTEAALSEGSGWAAIEAGIVENPAAFVYYDAPKFFGFIQKLTELAAPMAAAATGDMSTISGSPFSTLNLQAFESATLSLHVSDGVGSRQCVSLKADSELSKLLSSLLSDLSKENAGKLLKIVDQNTLLAFNLSGRFLQTYSASARAIRTSTSATKAADGATSPEWEKYQKTVEALGKLYQRQKLRNLGVVISGPRPEQMAMLMGPQGAGATPDVGLMFEFEAATDTKAVSELLNNTAILLAGDSGLLELPVATTGKGKPLPDGSLPFADVIRIRLGEGTELVGAGISSSSLLVARDEVTLDAMRRRLESTTPVITNESLASRGVDANIANSDMYLLLSTAPLVELARGFAPMGLMMAPPDLGIGMPEVDEVLKLLTVKLLALQNSVQAKDNLFCYDAKAVAL